MKRRAVLKAWPAENVSEAHVGPQRRAGEARAADDDAVVDEQMDAAPGGEIASRAKLVGEGVAVVAAVMPEIVITGHIDHARAGKPVAQPVDRRG